MHTLFLQSRRSRPSPVGHMGRRRASTSLSSSPSSSSDEDFTRRRGEGRKRERVESVAKRSRSSSTSSSMSSEERSPSPPPVKVGGAHGFPPRGRNLFYFSPRHHGCVIDVDPHVDPHVLSEPYFFGHGTGRLLVLIDLRYPCIVCCLSRNARSIRSMEVVLLGLGGRSTRRSTRNTPRRARRSTPKRKAR